MPVPAFSFNFYLFSSWISPTQLILIGNIEIYFHQKMIHEVWAATVNYKVSQDLETACVHSFILFYLNCARRQVLSRCSVRIEASVVLPYSSQGPRVCVINLFSQLILCWADNGICPLPSASSATINCSQFSNTTVHHTWCDPPPPTWFFHPPVSTRLFWLMIYLLLLLVGISPNFYYSRYLVLPASSQSDNKYTKSCLPVGH